MKNYFFKQMLVALCMSLSYIALAETTEPQQMAQQMIIEKPSPFATMKETVAAIKKNIEATEGWIVNSVKPLDKGLRKHGAPKILPVTLINTCNPKLAAEMLKEDSNRYASIMMPCSISVYQKSDGKIYIAHINARMAGKMFGGTIAELMGNEVADKQDQFLTFDK